MTVEMSGDKMIGTIAAFNSARAAGKMAEAEMAQRRYNEFIRHLLFVLNAKRYDAPSRIPKVGRK